MSRLATITSVLLALAPAAGAQPSPYNDDYEYAQTQYSQGYDDGYQACLQGGGRYSRHTNRAYRQGFSEGYRACTLSPSGTANSPTPQGVPPGPGPAYGGWTPIGRGDLRGPSQKLLVGAQAGRFSRLRIQATTGSPMIDSIDVRYVDDSLQTIDIHRRMRPGETFDVALGPPRTISSITVSGRPERSATFGIAAG